MTTAHVVRYLVHYRHSGHVWQGRFQAFPVREDGHLLTVPRYEELLEAIKGHIEDYERRLAGGLRSNA